MFLGAELEQGLEQMMVGDKTIIIPMVYQTVLRKAHQRTFNLQQRLQETQPNQVSDPDIEEILDQPVQKEMLNPQEVASAK